MNPSRRMTLVAAAVILSVASCGDPDQDRTAGGSGVGAPVVIQVAPAGADPLVGAPEAAADGGDAATSMMVAAMTFTYEGDLPALDGEAPSWFFAADASPTTEQISALAAAFGVSGEVVELLADQGGGWQIGSADYTGPSITVSKSATLDWWYNPGPLAVTSSSGCARAEVLPAPVEPIEGGEAGETSAEVIEPAPVDPTQGDPALDECVPPQPPSGVPDAAAAETAARDLLRSAGIDDSAYEFEVVADEWGAYVTAYLVVGGYRTPLSASVGFGGDAAVSWASGVLAAPLAGPSYPLQGTAAGLEALEEQQNQWMGVSDAAGVKNDAGEVAVASEDMSVLPCPEPALVDPAVTEPLAEPAPAVEPVTETGAAPPIDSPAEPTPDVTVGLAPIDCAPVGPIDPIEVTLTGVEADLTLVWAADGTVWLLPAYTFLADDGGRYSVVAIDDAYLETTAG